MTFIPLLFVWHLGVKQESWADLVLGQQQPESHIALKQNTRGGSGMLQKPRRDSQWDPGGWGSGNFLDLEGHNLKTETETKGVVMHIVIP